MSVTNRSTLNNGGGHVNSVLADNALDSDFVTLGDGQKKVKVSSIAKTNLEHLSGSTGNLQAQLDSKASTSSVALKADKTYVDTQDAGLQTQINSLSASIPDVSNKVDKTWSNSRVSFYRYYNLTPLVLVNAATGGAWRSITIPASRLAQVYVRFTAYNGSITAGDYYSSEIERSFFRNGAAELTARGATTTLWTISKLTSSPVVLLNPDNLSNQIFLQFNGRAGLTTVIVIDEVTLKIMN